MGGETERERLQRGRRLLASGMGCAFGFFPATVVGVLGVYLFTFGSADLALVVRAPFDTTRCNPDRPPPDPDDPRPAPACIPLVERPLQAGTVVGEADVTWQLLPPAYVPDNALLTRSEVIGRTVAVPLFPGEMFRKERMR